MSQSQWRKLKHHALLFAATPGTHVPRRCIQADLGKTLMYGLVISIPVVIIAGPFLGRFLRRLNIPIPPLEKIETEEKKLPGVFESFMLALLPVLLIALAVIANTFFPANQ
jgi:H+/gluconate symporter-like permease